MQTGQLTSRQFIFAVYKTQVGVGILTLPRELAEKSGTAGFLTMFITWGMSIAVSFFIIRSMRKFPGLSFNEVLARIFGRAAGWGLSALWSFYSFFAAFTIILSTINLIQVWILQEIAAYKLAFLFLLPLYMVCRHTEAVVGRFAEFVFLSTMWLYPMLFFALKGANILNILPIFRDGPGAVLAGVSVAVVPYLGLEAALFLYPRHQDPKRAFRDLAVANSMSTLLYVAVTVISFVFFDNDQIKQHIWPTLELLKTVKFAFLERFEIVFLPFYLMVILYTPLAYLFIGARTAAALFRRPSHLGAIRLACLAIFGATLFFEPDYDMIRSLSRIFAIIGYFVFAFPIVLWLGTLLHRKPPKENNVHAAAQ